MATGSSAIFSGSSRYSSDFSSVINRSVAIASLPIQLLQQQKNSLDAQVTALTSLKGKASTLQSSLQAIGSAFGSTSYSSSVGNSSAIGVTLGDSPTEGSWTVGVDNLGSSTAYVVSGFPSVADPNKDPYISGSTQTILIAGQLITLHPAGQTLRAVVEEINKAAGTSVQASIVNVGTTSSPNYQLSLQSRKLGAVDLTFSDDATQSGNTAAQRGTLAQYSVNGTTISTDSSTVTLSPGVSLNLLQTTSSPTTVSVSRNTGALETVLNNFVSAFNSMNGEIASQHGQTTSALAGSSILNSANSSLRQLMSAASPSNGFNSLYDLGLGFDSKGNLTLDSDQFHKATDGKLDQVKAFLGTTDGTGLLGNLNSIMDSVVKDGSGYLTNAIDTTTKSSQNEAQHISDEQDRVDKFESDLRTRMAAADASIAALEQQVAYFTNMFAAMQTAQKANGN